MIEETRARSAVLVLGGVLENQRILSHLLAKAQTLVAADGGVRNLERFGVTPNALIGDLDSIPFERQRSLRDAGVAIYFEREQETTDFEKALRWLKHERFEEVFIVGFGGGASDHFLTNVAVLLRYASEFKRLEAFDDANRMEVLLPSTIMHLDRDAGTRLSLIPLPAAAGVLTTGLQYELNNESLEFGRREGLGNRIVQDHCVSISINSGALLVIVELEEHLRAGAPSASLRG